MRRLANSVVCSTAVAARCYTPPADLKALYERNFVAEKYPIDIIPSDSTVFAQFLFKAAEAKGSYDAILKDFDTIASAHAKLPVFWERNADVEKMSEFKGLSAPTFFTLLWMQSNGMLEQLSKVHDVYETLASAARKKVVAKIYVGDAKDTANISKAKEAATKAWTDKSRTLDFKVLVDQEVISGFTVDVGGVYVNEGSGRQVASAASSAAETDYTNVPVPKVHATVWDDNVETEVLRKYFDQLAQYDAEEAKLGV